MKLTKIKAMLAANGITGVEMARILAEKYNIRGADGGAVNKATFSQAISGVRDTPLAKKIRVYTTEYLNELEKSNGT